MPRGRPSSSRGCFAHEVGHTAGNAAVSDPVALCLSLSTRPTELESYRFELVFAEHIEHFLPEVSPDDCRRRLFLGRLLKFVGDTVRLKVALRFFGGESFRSVAGALSDVLRVFQPSCAPGQERDVLAYCGIPTDQSHVAYMEAFLAHYTERGPELMAGTRP